MSQQEKSVGAVGLIRVAGLEITITPLSQGEELLLDRTLRRAAQEAHGDLYTPCKPLLEAMRDAPADRLEAVREITRLTASRAGVSAAAVFDFRTSAEGLALEIFARGRRATPGLTLDGLRAVVTAANADEVAGALFELIEAGPEKK